MTAILASALTLFTIGILAVPSLEGTAVLLGLLILTLRILLRHALRPAVDDPSLH